MGARDTSRCFANRCRNAGPCRPDHRGRGNGPFAPWYGRCHRRPCAWRPSQGETLRQRAFALGAALLAGCAAISTGTTIANHGSLIVVAVPAVAAIAGLIGGISLAMARETTRFILFTTIAAGLSAPEVRPFGMTLLFFLGGTWTLGLSLLLHAVFGRAKRAAESSAACGRRRALSRYCSDDGGNHSFACQAGNIRFESGRV